MTDVRDRGEGPTSWRPATLRTSDWLFPAPAPATASAPGQVPGRTNAGGPPDPAPAPYPDCSLTARIDSALWYGTGFALLRGLDLDGLTDRQAVERCAELVGALCAPAGLRLQRSAHELLTAATAPALPHAPAAPHGPAAPHAPSGDENLLLPHMDRGEGPEPPRLLALLCVRPATEGGASLLASGAALHEELAGTDPDALQELHQDVRFGRGAGFDRVRPVFRHDAGVLRVHYNRYWIARGQGETGTSFPPARGAALARMEKLLQDPAMVLTVPLRRGDLLLVNNSAVLHGRTPFTDHGAPAAGRCYARVWAD
ncbi:TauD/TfdA family dioxygenase [Streptomyces sp. NPDC046275]|uniref:TauD/TfdA family dioxygenase n=1 Tax=Streptomyces sp. NPDC046275 TaxID=3157201 RepID=UPI0033D51BDD